MNYFWKQSWPLANSGTNSENIKIFLSSKVNQNAWKCLLLSTLLKSNSVKSQRGRGNGYQTTSISSWKEWCLSLSVTQCWGRRKIPVLTVPGPNSGREGYERLYEEGSGEKAAVGLDKKGERRVQPNKAMNIYSTHVKKIRKPYNILTNPSLNWNASCNLKS